MCMYIYTCICDVLFSLGASVMESPLDATSTADIHSTVLSLCLCDSQHAWEREGGRCGSHLYGHKCITETAHHPYRHACTSHPYVQILCTKYGSNDSSPTEHSSACHTVTSVLLSAVRQRSAPSPGPDKLHRVPATLQGAGEGDRLARRGLQRVVHLPLSTIHHYHTWCGGIQIYEMPSCIYYIVHQ